MSEHPRDCPHGRQWGKCDTCDLLEAQGHIAALVAEVERLRATLAAKEETQRANEDEMDAEIERLRAVAEAATQMRAACPMEWTHGECDGSQCAPVCCALDALDEEVGE